MGENLLYNLRTRFKEIFFKKLSQTVENFKTEKDRKIGEKRIENPVFRSVKIPKIIMISLM